MPAHNRRLKQILFELGTTQFECQVKSWKYEPGVQDGDRMYTFCPDGEFIEDTEPEPTLELTFFSDWRSGGISDYLTLNSNATVDFTIDHHPGMTGEHVRFSGKVKLKAPAVGGDARATEETEVTLMVVGTPNYTRV